MKILWWFSLQQYEGSLFCHIFWPLFYLTIQGGEAKWHRNFDRNEINRKELNEAYHLTLAIPKMVWWDGWESFFSINDMRNDTFALFASSHGMSVILTHGTALGWAQIQIVDGIKRIHSSWAGGGHPEHFEPNYRSVAYSTKQHTASKVLASQY